MTAAELFEVVKDVPREAWPNGIHYDWNQHGPKRAKYWHDTDMRMSDAVAENAFIGSMTAWLASKSLGCTEMKHQSHENSEMRFTVSINFGWTERGYEHVELVAALAAACKEAA